MDVDAQGNAYIGGDFYDSGARFGRFSLNSSGGNGLYIGKVNTKGQVLWAKSITGSSTNKNRLTSIDIDLKGQKIYAAGYFKGTLKVGSQQIVSTNQIHFDIFLLQLDLNGNFISARQYGGAGEDQCYAVQAGPNGEVYITGATSSPSWGQVRYPVYGEGDFFVARIGRNGLVNWIFTAGTDTKLDIGLGVTFDEKGFVYAIGYAEPGTLRFGNQSATIRSIHTTVFKLRAGSGALLWGTGFPQSLGHSIVFQNNIACLAGELHGAANFGGTMVNHLAGKDAYVGCIDEAGKLLWVQSINGAGATNSTLLYSLDIDSKGRIHIGGFFTSSDLRVGGKTYKNKGGADQFIARFERNGKYIMSEHIYGSADELLYKIRSGPNGGSYLYGLTKSSDYSFKGKTLVNPGRAAATLVYIGP